MIDEGAHRRRQAATDQASFVNGAELFVDSGAAQY
jgi:hypothetical protein